jgi:hypothetical protein
MDRVEFYDGATLLGAVNSSPYTFSWNITGVPDGTHSLKAVAFDVFGNHSETQPVSVLLDRTPPVGSIVNPIHLSTASGATLALTASASDGTGSGVKQVEFYSDFAATPIAVVTSSPYTYQWDVTGLSPGVHFIGVKIVDVANNAFAPSTSNILVPETGTIPGTEVPGSFSGSPLGCYSRSQQEIFMSQFGCSFGCSSTYDVNGDFNLNVLDLVRVMGGVCHE